MTEIKKTPLNSRHIELEAKMVDFEGWEMPLNYPGGIMAEHLATRKQAGLFDISHMGRFEISGKDALGFLQHVLTNNAAALQIGESQYTVIPDENGGAIDDAYLYRFHPDRYLLVVNASNTQKDWEHLQGFTGMFSDVSISDIIAELAMISLQGPLSREILLRLTDFQQAPEPVRNSLGIGKIDGVEVKVARTGYTGEPLCFELFIHTIDCGKIWDILIKQGAVPIGLGARDTLRLEAGLPLYGHELGNDSDGNPIPILACSVARIAVSFSPAKGSFVGRKALHKQHEALKKLKFRDFSLISDLPRCIFNVSITGRGIARPGDRVYRDGREVGVITSGTMVPFWKAEGIGLSSVLADESARRAVCLGLLDSNLDMEESLEIEVRGKRIPAVIVPYHMRSEAPPYSRSISFRDIAAVEDPASRAADYRESVNTLLTKAVRNTVWRQNECINLIPSEQTPSPMCRLLCSMDPAGRYAEHKNIKAFEDTDVFFYQGTDFICEVELLIQAELKKYLTCHQVEARIISGQMANTVVFSALMDYLNMEDRKREPKRLRWVLNHNIIKGGHLSAQPMGALRDFIAYDASTDHKAFVNFPVLADNPYQVDIQACSEIIDLYRPQLIILGKSMILHPEPVADIRRIVNDCGSGSLIMYDMAHVLGLIGPHFQEPFVEGADVVTGSTHKTFFGPQRGIVAGNFSEHDPIYRFWEAVERRAFPGSVSNHHLGTLLGLLMAVYEMNAFKDEYQKKVVDNAKAFALALRDCGLDVAGDPAVSYTETHQVIVNVGYGEGPGAARKLEENNIIVNYQATPEEEGFTAAGSLRLGVAEMTRFGMDVEGFRQTAEFIADIVLNGKAPGKEVADFRKEYTDMKYCFSDNEFTDKLQELHNLI